MLHYETIEPDTLELLKKLLKTSAFQDLRLVGGTSLALQIGHRKSIDIDLFGSIQCDDLTIVTTLKKIGQLTILKQTENIKIFIVNDVKVDIVNYPYPWLDDALIEYGIRLASVKDIAAMKLSAITNRGSRKDFIDLSLMLKDYGFKKMLEFYQQKYDDGSVFLVLKSLVYFDDAETEAMPDMLADLGWEKVKNSIKDALLEMD